MATYAVFLDTMIFLHYQPVAQIDWHAALGIDRADPVALVVAGVVVTEIDKHKDQSPRLRDRARRVSSEFEKYFLRGAAQLRDNVTITLALAAPQADFSALGLSQSKNDDVLLAAVIEYREAHPGVTCILVSRDMYLRLRAPDFAVDARKLDDTYALPVVEDEHEKEVKSLRRQLAVLSARLPRLELQAAGGGNTVRHAIAQIPPLTSAELEEALREEERLLPPVEHYRPPKPAVVNIDELTATGNDLSKLADISQSQVRRLLGEYYAEQDLARYAEERAEHLASFLARLQAQRERDADRARHFVAALQLVNEGNAPADDIDVRLDLPSGLWAFPMAISSSSTPLKRPSRPKPRSPFDLGSLGLGGSAVSARPWMPDIPTLDQALSRPNVSSFSISTEEPQHIKAHVRQVKHGLPVALPRLYLYLQPGSAVRPFQISYALHAANIPEPVRGEINVLLTEKAA
jgi:hypothetical protein